MRKNHSPPTGQRTQRSKNAERRDPVLGGRVLFAPGLPVTALERDTMKDAETALYLRHPLAVIWRQNSGRKGYIRFASINLPDYVGVAHDGRAIFCEVKREDTQLTEEQHDFLNKMANQDAWAYVWTPAGLYQLDEVPEKHLPRTRRKQANG